MICAGQHTSGTAGGIFLFDDALPTTNSPSGGSIELTLSSLSSIRRDYICRYAFVRMVWNKYHSFGIIRV